MNAASLAEDGTGRWKKGWPSSLFHSSPYGSGTGGRILGEREVLKSTFTVNPGPKPLSSLCNASGTSLPVPAGLPHRSQRPIPEHSRAWLPLSQGGL